MNDTVNIDTIQYIAVFGSILFLVFILNLIRKRKIREEYSLLWLFFGAVFLAMSVWRQSLEIVAGLLGIAYAPAALFLIMLFAIITILIHYSIVISKFSENINMLTQEVGLLKMELELLNTKNPGQTIKNDVS